MLEQVLIANGFSTKEAKLYLTILEAGEIPMGQIAKKSGIKRSTVYSLVEELEKKGTVSTTKRKGIKYISALPPRLLIERFEQSTELAKSMLPQLIEMAYTSPTKPRLRFYEGIDGICEILREASYTKQDYIGFTDYTKMPKKMYEFIQEKVVPQRKIGGVTLRLLMPKNETNLRVMKEYVEQVEHRIVDFPSRKNHIEIILYDGNKIGFVSFEKDEMFGVVMDSEAIYITLYDLFKVIWEGAKDSI